MGLFNRKRRHPGDAGMSPFKAGLIAVLLLVVGSYFGFTKANPFANPYKLSGVFENASGIKRDSPVRIAGVESGKVSKVEVIDRKTGAVRVEMEIKEDALPIHEDAELKIRPRILLEGNFFVDLRPGSPNSPVLEAGEKPIPMSQTSHPVQLPEILSVLKADVRGDLRTLLAEYSLKGLGGGGAEGFNDAIPFFEPAYRSTSLANDALLGVDPTRDLRRVLKGQQGVARALTVDEPALKDLVTNLNTVAGAVAREDGSLRAAVPALRDTLRAGSPALASLNSALPSLRAFAREALPGVRSSDETIDAALPFLRQARALVSPNELQGTAAELRRQIPNVVRLNRRLVPFLGRQRELASCTNRVLVPYSRSEIPSGEPGNSGSLVREQIQRSFVGLSGDSRSNDANTPWFRVQGVPPQELAAGQVEPVPPSNPNSPPPHRPDVPCETQDVPNLNAPRGPTAQFTNSSSTGNATQLRSVMQRYLRSDSYERLATRARERAEANR
jgi:ABC-type transporter Mla subunit MlaD